MIERIKLEDVACFNGSPQEIIFREDVGVIYGHNGTGKTTIARYLSDTSDSNFSSCELNFTPGSNPEVFVYDQNFINEVFYQTDEIEGIFTLGEVDSTTEKIIENCEKRISNINSEVTKKEQKIIDLKAELEEEKQEAHENVWRIVKGHKGGILDFCLDGYKANKARFFSKLNTITYEDELSYDFGDIEIEIEKITGENIQKKSNIDEITFSFSTYESDEIFNQRIVASDTSYLSEVIKKIDASDWVLEGRKLIESDSFNELKEDPCPFCQRELPDGFNKELEKLFDKTYEEKKK